MPSRKDMYFRNLLTLSLALLFPVIMAAQSEDPAPSAESPRNRSVKQRLEQILSHSGQTSPAATAAQSQPARFDPHSRDDAPPTSPLQAVRLPGAPTAAERYVFGRMDLATGNYPNAVATGAFQTGGPQSMAVANYYSSTVSILLANADGTFQPRVDYATGVEPGAIAVADFNGDHNLDLAVANWASGTLSILLGNGDGTFQPHIDYSVGGGYAAAIAVGDFNHDNKLDLAVTNWATSSVAILLGNGDGTFQPQVSYVVGNDPRVVVAGDFNGDNHLDLAVVAGSEQVAILLGNGDGTFKPAVQYQSGALCWSLVLGDFNGDLLRRVNWWLSSPRLAIDIPARTR